MISAVAAISAMMATALGHPAQPLNCRAEGMRHERRRWIEQVEERVGRHAAPAAERAIYLIAAISL